MFYFFNSVLSDFYVSAAISFQSARTLKDMDEIDPLNKISGKVNGGKTF